MTNPLVNAQNAAPDAEPPESIKGIGLLESFHDVQSLNDQSSWVESGLAYGGAAMEVVGLAVDPIGTLLSYGFAWMIEHVQPLQDALDWFAGDPAGVEAYAQQWSQVAATVKAASDEFGGAVRADTAQWTGQAGDAYRQAASSKHEALTAAGELAGTISSVVSTMGMVVSFVRDFVRDLVADCVSRLISYLLESFIPPVVSLAWVVPQAVAFIAKTVTKITEVVQKLLKTISNVSPKMARMVEVFGEITKALGKGGQVAGEKVAAAGRMAAKVADKIDLSGKAADKLAEKAWGKLDDTFGTDVVGRHEARFGGPDAPGGESGEGSSGSSGSGAGGDSGSSGGAESGADSAPGLRSSGGDSAAGASESAGGSADSADSGSSAGSRSAGSAGGSASGSSGSGGGDSAGDGDSGSPASVGGSDSGSPDSGGGSGSGSPGSGGGDAASSGSGSADSAGGAGSARSDAAAGQDAGSSGAGSANSGGSGGGRIESALSGGHAGGDGASGGSGNSADAPRSPATTTASGVDAPARPQHAAQDPAAPSAPRQDQSGAGGAPAGGAPAGGAPAGGAPAAPGGSRGRLGADGWTGTPGTPGASRLPGPRSPEAPGGTRADSPSRSHVDNPGRSTGGTGQRSTGSAEPRPAGGAEQRSTGGAEQRPTGGAEQRSTGGAEQRPTGGADQRSTGAAEQRPTDGAPSRAGAEPPGSGAPSPRAAGPAGDSPAGGRGAEGLRDVRPDAPRSSQNEPRSGDFSDLRGASGQFGPGAPSRTPELLDEPPHASGHEPSGLDLSDDLRAKLGDDLGHIRPSESGLSMVPHDRSGQDVPSPRVDPERFTVDVHGGPNGVRVGDAELSPKELAEIIKASPGYRAGDPVRLVSCRTGADTGDGTPNFAQELSRELDAEVLAPNTDAWVDNHGNLYASADRATFDTDSAGVPQPRIDSPGEWATFHPDTPPTVHTGPFPPGHQPDWTRNGELPQAAERRGLFDRVKNLFNGERRRESFAADMGWSGGTGGPQSPPPHPGNQGAVLPPEWRQHPNAPHPNPQQWPGNPQQAGHYPPNQHAGPYPPNPQQPAYPPGPHQQAGPYPPAGAYPPGAPPQAGPHPPNPQAGPNPPGPHQQPGPHSPSPQHQPGPYAPGPHQQTGPYQPSSQHPQHGAPRPPAPQAGPWHGGPSQHAGAQHPPPGPPPHGVHNGPQPQPMHGSGRPNPAPPAPGGQHPNAPGPQAPPQPMHGGQRGPQPPAPPYRNQPAGPPQPPGGPPRSGHGQDGTTGANAPHENPDDLYYVPPEARADAPPISTPQHLPDTWSRADGGFGPMGSRAATDEPEMSRAAGVGDHGSSTSRTGTEVGEARAEHGHNGDQEDPPGTPDFDDPTGHLSPGDRLDLSAVESSLFSKYSGNHSAIWRQDDASLFRHDERPPQEIFDTKRGFRARGARFDLWQHLENSRGGLVSTTRDQEHAIERARGGQKGGVSYVYVIDAPGGLDVDAMGLGDSRESEVAFAKHIDVRYIKECMKIDKKTGKVLTRIRNQHYWKDQAR